MYTVTFYSFKGGVGRTLALANVAFELAKMGKRVLVVDFDLEAPGIHTFKGFRGPEGQLGIVDLVNAYMDTNRSPDVRDYIYEVLGVGKKDGHLWIMPAGKTDTDYHRKLGAINWGELYSLHRGFLFFEDIKAQWQKAYGFDYVLIDSRTGHTDIGGICTRQLPEAVVVLFFPNEQNLDGLKPIVAGIRHEDTKEENATVLHFVMSNVPDLDDEDAILASFEHRFREELDFRELSSIIHHYNSLSLLQQTLFLAERPKSRLAKEYRELALTITRHNIEDRDGVLQKLKKKHRLRLFKDDKFRESEIEYTDRVAEVHSSDGELLYRLAAYVRELGLSTKSEVLLQRSIESGYRSPESLLAQADIRQKEGDKESAEEDVWQVFNFPELTPEQLGAGINILRRIDPRKLLDLSNTVALRDLSPRNSLLLADELNWCKQGLEALVKLLTGCLDRYDLTKSLICLMKEALLLSYIGLGKFKEAVRLFGEVRLSPESFDRQHISGAFNYAMAEWGLRKELSQDLLERVLELNSEKPLPSRPNYSQCLALARFGTGDRKGAEETLDNAIKKVQVSRRAEFSCWRYLTVTPSEFLSDCESMKRMFSGEQILPSFFTA